MKRRLVAVVLAAVLVFTSMSSAVNAWAASALTKENMTDSILEMKGRIGVGDEFTVFDYDFYENGSGAMWYFYWNTEDNGDYIYASCDEQKHILSFNNYSSNSNYKTVPQYTSDELLEDVMAAIKRIEPEIADHVVLKNVNCRSYGGCYIYYFNRIENGIEMPDNGLSISIDYNTKKITNYSAEWLYGVKVPGATGLISKEEAAAKAGRNVEMKLKYYITYDANGEAKAFLAYVPDTGYTAVDAHSGKIYEEKNYWGSRTNDNAADEVKAENVDEVTAGAKLSDAEIIKIDELKDIISSEKAVEIVKANKALLIDPNMNIVERARLYNDGKGGYYWSLYLRDNRPYDWETNDNYRAYASANIDARTGAILSFNCSLKSLYDFTDEEVTTVKAKFTKSQCRSLAEDFLKEVCGDRFAKTALLSTNENHPIAYDYAKNLYTYAGFAFNYGRVNEDIPVNGNSINVSVDAVSGKVYSYNYSWEDNVELPSSKGIIDAKAAFDKYIAFDGFDLVYEIVTNYVEGTSYYGDDVEKSIRLVYRTAISPSYVDAFTGKQLNWDGSEYAPVVKDYAYTDIAGSKYERAIRILASMGVGFEGDKFEPDKAITREEFQKLADDLSGFIGYSSFKLTGSKALTRQMAAKAVVSYLGLEKLAALDIYKTGYSDAKKISKGYAGYVALAKGLGIMKAASGKKFKPSAKVTRGEAAELLLKATGIEF